MSVRTTVTLDEDVLQRVKDESRSRGVSFKETLNDLLRTALLKTDQEPPQRSFHIQAVALGAHPWLDYDDIEGLIEYGEGPLHR
jgi:hypothetical protein